MFCQHKNVCLFCLIHNAQWEPAHHSPHSCGPAIPPLHSVSRSMAMYWVRLQEEERGRVTADGFQLCHRTGHTPAMWQWVPAWQSHGWPTLGHATEQTSKLLSRAQYCTSPMAETPNFGYATHGVTSQERGWNRGLPAILVKGCIIHPECENRQCWSTQ